MSNYIEMKKELDVLKQKLEIKNDDNNETNLFKYINLIRVGVKHQLNKKITNTKLLYRCSKDGDDSAESEEENSNYSDIIDRTYNTYIYNFNYIYTYFIKYEI